MSENIQETSVEETPVAAAPQQEQQQVVVDANNVSAQQRIAILRSIHGFFSAYDRVPGAVALQWGNALDALALVINSETKDLQKSVLEVAKQ